MKRLFITTYQKSGTHQIMPMFSNTGIGYVIDESHSCWIDIPDRYRLNKEINYKGIEKTIGWMNPFRKGVKRAFGHVTCMPEYVKVLEDTETKVIFNVRDPRDIIVAEYENGRRHFRKGYPGYPLYHYLDYDDNTFIFDKDDPITELIIFAGARWPKWIGWLDYDPVMIVKYEDLRLQTEATSRKILKFLDGVESPPLSFMIKNALPNKSNQTFRKGVVGEWTTTFQPHHLALAESVGLDDITRRLGYEW